MSSILFCFRIFCCDSHLLENIFAKQQAPSTTIAIFSLPRKSIVILALLPELGKDCAINDDSVKHSSSLSYPLPQTIFDGLCIYRAVVPKLRSFPQKSIVISALPSDACRMLQNAVNNNRVKYTLSPLYDYQRQSIFASQCISKRKDIDRLLRPLRPAVGLVFHSSTQIVLYLIHFNYARNGCPIVKLMKYSFSGSNYVEQSKIN